MQVHETKSTLSRTPLRLTGKVALVTGGGCGIGRVIALILAQAGADVVVNDVNLDAAEQITEEVSMTLPLVISVAILTVSNFLFYVFFARIKPPEEKRRPNE